MNGHEQSINEIGCVKCFVLHIVEIVNHFQEVITFLAIVLVFEEPFSLDHFYFHLDSSILLFYTEEFLPESVPEFGNYTSLLIF